MTITYITFYLIVFIVCFLVYWCRRKDQAEKKIMATLADIKAKVEAQNTVVGSAVTLLGELKAKLDAAIASGDPAALQAISDELDSETASLASAVAANTPAAPLDSPAPGALPSA